MKGMIPMNKILGIIFLILFIIIFSPFIILGFLVYFLIRVLPTQVEMIVYKKSSYYKDYKTKYRIGITYEFNYKLYNKLIKLNRDLSLYNISLDSMSRDLVICSMDKIVVMYNVGSYLCFDDKANTWTVSKDDYYLDEVYHEDYVEYSEINSTIYNIDDIINNLLHELEIDSSDKKIVIAVNKMVFWKDYKKAKSSDKFLFYKSYKDLVNEMKK